MEIFSSCQEINEFLSLGDEFSARNALIKLLADMDRSKAPYPQIVNHFIRATGLFPYLDLEAASWDQKFVSQAFLVDVGNGFATLHREQALVLGKLLGGSNIAVSAPTSFGKSFIIDAYIAARKPDVVVIIVPTIALMDETRRRIFKKFSREYTIITAPDSRLGDRNIFIFPQERVFGYLNQIERVDLLVVDEFYKASSHHDKERAPSLVKAILKLSKRARQRYYLAPNIKRLNRNVFTQDMEFLELLNFNTVFLEKFDLYKEIGADDDAKSQKLMEILSPRSEKSLVYAGTYSEIKKISQIIISRMAPVERPHTTHFANWLRANYRQDWVLADLVERGVGVHNGQMHRCLSQLQVRLFEQQRGFDSIISTSSIIEGVNTSAQNVVIWRSKIGASKLKDFTYKNIIGRGGRMFKYFVGKIYLLDVPPKEEDTQLEIEFPEQILGDLDEQHYGDDLTNEQKARVIEYKEIMSELIGEENFLRLKRDNLLQDSDSEFLLRLARDMRSNPSEWKGFGYLNSRDPEQWERMLYKLVRLKPREWDSSWTKVVSLTKALAFNWERDLPDLLDELDGAGIDIDEFFKLERAVTFKLSALLNDANELHRIMIDPSVDISRFVARVGHAFLPGSVYHLEEYGLPRMIAKKIHRAGLINFTHRDSDLDSALRSFQELGLETVLAVRTLNAFERYIVRFFFEGITPDDDRRTLN